MSEMKIQFDNIHVTVLNPDVQDQVKRLIVRLSKKQRNPRQFKEWTLEDDTKLMEMFATGASLQTIGQALGRASGAIYVRVRVLQDKGDLPGKGVKHRREKPTESMTIA